MPRLPRKMQAERPGAHTAPNDARTTPRRTSDPLRSLKCCTCHAKSKQKGPEPTLHQTTPGRRQGVHQTPCRARSAAPATQNASRKARSPHCTKRRQDDARAYIRPLVEQKCRACHAKCKQKSPEPTLHQTTPGRRQSVHQTPCRARSAAPATQNASRKARSPHCTKRRQDDARAYIRPLVEPEVPRLPRKMQAERPGAHTAPNDARTTPGRTSDPLRTLKCCTLPRKIQAQSVRGKCVRGKCVGVSVFEVSVLEVSVLGSVW